MGQRKNGGNPLSKDEFLTRRNHLLQVINDPNKQDVTRETLTNEWIKNAKERLDLDLVEKYLFTLDRVQNKLQAHEISFELTKIVGGEDPLCFAEKVDKLHFCVTHLKSLLFIVNPNSRVTRDV